MLKKVPIISSFFEISLLGPRMDLIEIKFIFMKWRNFIIIQLKLINKLDYQVLVFHTKMFC